APRARGRAPGGPPRPSEPPLHRSSLVRWSRTDPWYRWSRSVILSVDGLRGAGHRENPVAGPGAVRAYFPGPGGALHLQLLPSLLGGPGGPHVPPARRWLPYRHSVQVLSPGGVAQLPNRAAALDTSDQISSIPARAHPVQLLGREAFPDQPAELLFTRGQRQPARVPLGQLLKGFRSVLPDAHGPVRRELFVENLDLAGLVRGQLPGVATVGDDHHHLPTGPQTPGVPHRPPPTPGAGEQVHLPGLAGPAPVATG